MDSHRLSVQPWPVELALSTTEIQTASFSKENKKKLPEQLYDQHITYGYIMLTAYFKHIFS